MKDDGPPLSSSFGTRVRTAGGTPAGGPAPVSSTVPAAPWPAAGTVLAPPYVPPAPGTPVTYGSVDDRVTGIPDPTVGRPRTAPRPMPEYPRAGYRAYRLLGNLPGDVGRWLRLLDWALGRPAWLLYVGITCRASFIRRVEHSDSKEWAGDVTDTEEIRGEHWATLNDTIIDDSTCRPYLVFDVTATADNGVRPILPGEYIDTEPHYRLVHDQTVEVYYLDDTAGVMPAGNVAEGARTGEKRLIQAWAGGPRPVHNIEHNEGDHAVHRVARRYPRLVALARRQALALALVWFMLGIAVAQLAGASWWMSALGAAALLQAGQIMRLMFTGFPGPRRRKPRRPRGRKRHQRRRKR